MKNTNLTQAHSQTLNFGTAFYDLASSIGFNNLQSSWGGLKVTNETTTVRGLNAQYELSNNQAAIVAAVSLTLFTAFSLLVCVQCLKVCCFSKKPETPQVSATQQRFDEFYNKKLK